MLNAIYFYRVSRWLYLHHIPVLPKLITLLIFLIYNSKIPYQAKIGRESTFGYGGMGVVIHSKSIIGENCTICQQVTIGGGNSRFPGVPVIGNNVYCERFYRYGWYNNRKQCYNRSKRSRNQTSSR